VDLKQLTQEGTTIGAMLSKGVSDRYQRGQLQPFLPKYSNLLPDAVSMSLGAPSNLPHINILDELPKDSPLPGWASLLKGGELVVTDDGDGKASVYVPGENAQQAFARNYAVLRHVLQTLLPEDGHPLQIRAYAFTNDYGNCQIKVCLDPFLTSRTNFASPPVKAPLNLESLNQFFRQNVQLQGGTLDSSNNLILVGKKTGTATLSGQPVELSDLAAAYRAVFHSGDNLPFISLDPHTNPAMVTVNFGGYLEDTRIGSVVLESDKRFKTITSGLDPTSFIDLRKDIRKNIPTFATVGERDLLSSQLHQGWEGTRLWFYPDSVEVQTSLDGREGVISRAQFNADAERSRDDFKSTADFDNAKKSQLSPSIRMNIDDLNRNYPFYASIFTELGELENVARLMGLCIWLQKNAADKLDLDALLSVQMPNAPTPREKPQQVTSLSLNHIRSQDLGLGEAENRSVLTYLTPYLGGSVNSVFPDDKNLAEFLTVSRGNSSDSASGFMSEAAVVRQYCGGSKVAELITNKKSLEAFASVVGDGVKAPAPDAVVNLENDIDSMKPIIDDLKRRIEKIEAIMNRSTPEVYNSYVKTHNQLANQEREIVSRYNAEIGQYNQMQTSTRSIVEINGGIGLEPAKFKVVQREASPALDAVKRVAQANSPESRINGEAWVKSNPLALESMVKPMLKLNRSWKSLESHVIGNADYFWSSTATGEDYWRQVARGDSWHDLLNTSFGSVERYFDITTQTLKLARFDNNVCVDSVSAKNLNGVIVFTRSKRSNIAVPTVPPHWWN